MRDPQVLQRTRQDLHSDKQCPYIMVGSSNEICIILKPKNK